MPLEFRLFTLKIFTEYVAVGSTRIVSEVEFNQCMPHFVCREKGLGRLIAGSASSHQEAMEYRHEE